MTIHDIIACADFPQKSVVKQLLCEILALSLEQLIIEIDTVLTQPQYDKFVDMYHQYSIQHKPLEYIIGHVTFFGQDFLVNQHTLIPRTETEYMISSVCEYVRLLSSYKQYILRDIGTGCGVLACSVLIQTPDRWSQLVMTDISPDALDVARHNYDRLVKPIKDYDTMMWTWSLLDFITNARYRDEDVILVANLPYIPDETFDTQVSDTVRLREPRIAFVGGDDGLGWYKQMLDQILNYHRAGQIWSIVCFCEMMTWQLDILQKKYADIYHFHIHATFHFNIIIVQISMLK